MNVSLAGISPGEVLVEANLASSATWPGTGDIPVGEIKRRWLKLPWRKKTAIVYQAAPLLTVVLATGAFGMSRSAPPSDYTTVLRTPIHHFAPAGAEAFAGLVSGLQGPVTLEDELENLTSWPVPSTRATTPESARALQRATQQDPAPTSPPLVIDDGLGI
jgi:hypothetical protein